MKQINRTKPAIVAGRGKEQQGIEMEPIWSAETSTYELRISLQVKCALYAEY